MRIAVFHELPHGGARRAMNAFSEELKKKHVVDLFVVDEKDDKSEHHFYNQVFFHKFIPKFWIGKNWRVRLYKDTVELFHINQLHKDIAHSIDAKKYDVVLVGASKFIQAPFLMKFLKTPFVFFTQDPYYRIIYDPLLTVSKDLNFFKYWYERSNRLVRKILDKQHIQYAQACLAPSKFIARLFSETYNKHVDIVYDGVDASFFSPNKQKKDIDLFYIGSYEPIDGYELLEKTLSQIKVKITVRKLIKEEEWISDDKILRDFYQRTKIMFCPARREGLGLVLLEALACGATVVALNEAGHKEIVKQGKNGYLVDSHPKQIAKLLTELLANPKKIKRLGENGIRDIQNHWTWQKRTKDLEKFLLAQVKSRHKSR